MGLGGAIANMMALLSLDNEDFMRGVNDTLESTESFVGRLSSVGGGILVGGLSAAGAAIGAIGAATWAAGDTIDAALDTIQTRTGATGDTLQALQADFENVFTDFPTDADTAAGVIAALNSRLDVTGPLLTDMTGPLLESTRLLGGDATKNAELFTRVLGDWSVPLDQGSGLLDKLFVASQSTGVGMDSLMQKVVQFGSPMRLMGFELDDSIALFAKWEQEGVNAELVMGSLRIAAGEFAREGVDLADGLWQTVDAIQNAESESEALAKAMDVFGARAGPDMAAAILEGRFEVEDLIGTLQNAGGAILETSDELIGFTEKWDMFKNKMTTILAPIGQTAEQALTGVMDTLVGIFERPEVQAGITQFAGFATQLVTTFATYIPVAIDYLFQFVDFLQQNQGVVIGILAAMGVAVGAFVYTTLIPAALAAMGALLPVILVMAAVGAVAYLVYEAWTNNWGGIRDYLMGVWANLQPTFETLKQWLGAAIPAALQWLSDMWNNVLLPALQRSWDFFQNYIWPVLVAVADVIDAVLGIAIKAVAGYILNIWLPNFQKATAWIRDNVLPVIQKVASWLSDKLGPAFSWVGDKVGDLVDWLHELADKLRNISLPDWMTPGSPTPWEIGLWGVEDALNSLSRTSLPRFEAAVALQPSPLGAGSVDIQSRDVGVDSDADTGRGSSGRDDDNPMMREIYRMLRDLPQTIARANRDTFEKARRE
jgi:phage-related minor tail protein